MMDLPEPDLPAWRSAIDVAVAQWTAADREEGALRLVYSRGRESGSAPTAYLTVNRAGTGWRSPAVTGLRRGTA